MTCEDPPINCQRCSRLVAFRKEVALREPDWFGGAVPSFGDANAELLIVGLAPGLQGAHRTGRPFTGDGSGDMLYAAIEKFGFSRGTYGGQIGDGLVLENAMITNAVRCVPPKNKPTGAEISQCRPFLKAQIDALPNLRILISLGKIAHDSTIRALGLKLRDHPFGHGAHHQIELGDRTVHLISSYHCSRYNTNTKRLTLEMFEAVFAQAKDQTSSAN